MASSETLEHFEQLLLKDLLDCYKKSLEDIPIWEYRWFFSNCSFALFSAVQRVFRDPTKIGTINLLDVLTQNDCEMMEQYGIGDPQHRVVARVLLV